MRTTKETEQTRETLLEILQSYKRMIEHSSEKYPTVVLNDIHASINYVLERNGIQ